MGYFEKHIVPQEPDEAVAVALEILDCPGHPMISRVRAFAEERTMLDERGREAIDLTRSGSTEEAGWAAFRSHVARIKEVEAEFLAAVGESKLKDKEA